jgi:hypothetical protein
MGRLHGKDYEMCGCWTVYGKWEMEWGREKVSLVNLYKVDQPEMFFTAL